MDVRALVLALDEMAEVSTAEAKKYRDQVAELHAQLAIAHKTHDEALREKQDLRSELLAKDQRISEQAERADEKERELERLRKKYDSQTKELSRILGMGKENDALHQQLLLVNTRAFESAIEAGADVATFSTRFLGELVFAYPERDEIVLHRESAEVRDYKIDPSPFTADKPAWRFRVTRRGYRSNTRIWQEAELLQIAAESPERAHSGQ